MKKTVISLVFGLITMLINNVQAETKKDACSTMWQGILLAGMVENKDLCGFTKNKAEKATKIYLNAGCEALITEQEKEAIGQSLLSVVSTAVSEHGYADFCRLTKSNYESMLDGL